ncbi:MAG: hypothetical protein ACK56I_15090, partial [bacterium]
MAIAPTARRDIAPAKVVALAVLDIEAGKSDRLVGGLRRVVDYPVVCSRVGLVAFDDGRPIHPVGGSVELPSLSAGAHTVALDVPIQIEVCDRLTEVVLETEEKSERLTGSCTSGSRVVPGAKEADGFIGAGGERAAHPEISSTAACARYHARADGAGILRVGGGVRAS